MFLIFQDNFIIDDFLLSDVITSNCKFIKDSDCHIIPFNFDDLFHLKKLNINDLLNLDNKRLNLWIEFRQYLNLSLNNKEITIYKNVLYQINENNKYENDDWSILYYGNISENIKINNDIKNFLLKINCPFNENMSFRQ
jgi:hypothetical protein